MADKPNGPITRADLEAFEERIAAHIERAEERTRTHLAGAEERTRALSTDA